jgi:hypothetical protein
MNYDDYLDSNPLSDISVITTKTEIFASSSTSSPTWISYQHVYVPYIQFLYIVLLIWTTILIVKFYKYLTKK